MRFREFKRALLFMACASLFALALLGSGSEASVKPAPQGDDPPALSRPLLGTIPLDRAAPVNVNLIGGQKILRLPGGQLYIRAKMDIDADGSPRARVIDPCAGCGNPQTSLTYPGFRGQEQFVNAENIPYIVLPGGFFQRFGIGLGDVAAVIFRDRIEYAIFADIGPRNKIGEGSITLSQSLGHDPFITRRNGTRIVGSNIPRDVIYIVFPGSRASAFPNNQGLTPTDVVARTREKGRELFTGLGGHPPQ